MKAIILAAGRGVRLGSHTADKPKCLLPLGGRTLIQRSMENLAAVGVDQVVLVVGYRHEMIEEMVARHFPRGFYKVIMNPDYTRGSGSSLICAHKELKGNTLIIESDLLYEKEVLERMLSPRAGRALAMGHFGHGRREVKIYLRNGHIERAAWGEPDDTDATGDWVGFTRLCPSSSIALREMLEQANPNQGKEISYEFFVFELIRHFSFQSVYIDDLLWVEIDNEMDLMLARSKICHQIRSPVPAAVLPERSAIPGVLVNEIGYRSKSPPLCIGSPRQVPAVVSDSKSNVLLRQSRVGGRRTIKRDV